MKIQKTRHYSYKIGNLAKGCKLCVKGEKSVLFITGLCGKHCFYCPISEKKYNKDVIYINEWPTKDMKDITEEIRLCSSKGVGIIGGDPLVKNDRTVLFIKKLKKKFGKKFHIHLYTPLNLVDEKKLRKLYEAGLDEIRFHPSVDNPKEWNKIAIANKFNWSVGVEIPVIPGKEKQTKKLIDFLEGKIDFLNLNELEYSDTNVSNLQKLKLKTKKGLSYGISGSEALALRLLRYCKNRIKNVHYCTATLKDKVQLANRIKKRAKNIAKPLDIVTDEGTLLRGAIYLAEISPSFGYHKKLDKMTKARKSKITVKLNRLLKQLRKDFRIKKDIIAVDHKKLRIVTSIEVVDKIKEDINKNILNQCLKDKNILNSKKDIYLAIVEEYPTWDQLEMSVEFL